MVRQASCWEWSEFGFLGRMPADRRGIEQNLRALQRGQPRAFGIPLVPADQRSHTPDAGVESAVAEITGSEVVLFVVERIIRDVHLAVKAAQRPIRIEEDGGVVINARVRASRTTTQ